MSAAHTSEALQDAIAREDTASLQKHFTQTSPDHLFMLANSPVFKKSPENIQQLFKSLLTKRIDDTMKKIAEISKNPEQILSTFEILLKQITALQAIDEAQGKQCRYYAHCSLGHSYSIQMQYQAAFNAYYAASKLNMNGTTAFAGMISASTILAMKQDKEHVQQHASIITQHFEKSKPLQDNNQIRNMVDCYLGQIAEKLSVPSPKRRKP